jgi:hypothetical protein
LLQSVSGIGRYFHCKGCRRRLSFSNRRKAVFVGVVLLGLVSCCVLSVRQNSGLPYLGLPIVAMLAAVLVCWRARLRIVDFGAHWFSMLNFGLLGLIVGMLGYAVLP